MVYVAAVFQTASKDLCFYLVYSVYRHVLLLYGRRSPPTEFASSILNRICESGGLQCI